MKKRIFALICLLMCLFGAKPLAAQTLEPVDWERIDPNLPAGMALDEEKSYIENGVMHLVIDTYATDWDMVATVARKSSSLVLNPIIEKPQGAHGAKSYVDYRWFANKPLEVSEQQTAELLTAGYFNNGGNNQYIYHDQGLAIGRFDEGTGLFVPETPPAGEGDGFAVCWRMESDALKCERVRIKFEFNPMEPVYVKRHHAAEKYMAANVGNNDNVQSVVMKDGLVEYRVSNVDAAGEINTAVAAPSWLKVSEGWKAYLLDRGSKTELDIYSDGEYELKNSYVILKQDLEKKNMLYKRDWAVEWVDEKGETAAAFCLEGRFYVGDPELTISYDESIDPLPAGSMTLIEKNKIQGLSASYNAVTGRLHLAVDEKALPSNRKTDLDEATVSVLITPPSKAAQYILHGLKGDVIYGDGDRPQLWNEAVDIQPGQKIALEDLTELIYFREISATLANGKQMSYYFSPARWGDLGGFTLVLEWLDSSGATIGKQQITVMTDSYKVMEVKNQSLAGKPDGEITEPSVFAQDDDVYIVYAQLPQMGDDVQRYELALENEAGDKVELEAGESVQLYLPYPDGKKADQFVHDSFVIYHQLPDGSYEEFSVAKGNLTLTEYALCIEAASFSPYYLSWELAPDASALPETGDRSAIWLFVVLLVASAAGVMAMKKIDKTAA